MSRYCQLFCLLFVVFSVKAQSDSCTVFITTRELRKSASVFDYNTFLFRAEEFSTVKLRLKSGEHSFSDHLRPGRTFRFFFEKDSVYFFDYRNQSLVFRKFQELSGRKLRKLKENGVFFPADPSSEPIRHIHIFKDEELLTDSLCSMRLKAVNFIRQGDTASLRSYANTILCDECKKGNFVSYRTFSWRERIVFDFILGNHDQLLERSKYNDDYFAGGGYFTDYYDLCNANLLYDVVEIYLAVSDNVLSRIEKSGKLTGEEKEFLKTYWKGILIYLKSDGELPGELRTAGSDFEAAFPNSRFAPFVERNFITVRKKTASNAILLRSEYGFTVISGNLKNYIDQKSFLNFSLGYKRSRSTFTFGFSRYAFGEKANFPVFDTVTSAMGKVTVPSMIYEYKFALADFSHFDFNVLAGARVGSVAFPDFKQTIRGIGGTHWYFGCETSVSVVRNLLRRTQPREFTGADEERHTGFGNLMLTGSVLCAPNPFRNSLGVSGNLTTISIGLQYEMGSFHPVYRYRHR